MVKCPCVLCGGRGRRDGEEEIYKNCCPLFPASPLVLRCPHRSLLTGPSGQATLTTLREKHVSLQADVKEEKTSFLVGQGKVSGISWDSLIPKWRLCLHKQPLKFCRVGKKKDISNNRNLLSFQYRQFLYKLGEYADLNNLLRFFRFCHRYSRYRQSTPLRHFYSAIKSEYLLRIRTYSIDDCYYKIFSVLL